MEAAAQAVQTAPVQKEEAKFPPKKAGVKGRRKIDTLEKFRAWTPPEDGFKYEWNNGVIEKSPKIITFENLFTPIDVFICKGERVCSAEPVIPGFKTSADALFS